jgi:ribosome-binding protein aMBF1 (putative translation factor)
MKLALLDRQALIRRRCLLPSVRSWSRSDPVHNAPANPARRPGKPVVGVLRDGPPFFAPIGQVVADGAFVTCHLCGRAFRSVAVHLTSHGWTKAQYCEAFGLERRQSLEGADTRKLRAAAFSAWSSIRRVRSSPEPIGNARVDSVIEFIEQRQAQGWTWRQLAAASGQPQTWLRRHAASRKEIA